MPLNGRVVTIHVLSADHRYAPLDDIARLSGAADLGPTLMRSMPHARGVMVMRTCNRVTIYVDAPASADPRALKDAVEHELAAASHTPREDVRLRHLWGRDGLVDLFATAAGLESMVIGEREIAGQMRRAARAAWEDGTLSCDLGAPPNEHRRPPAASRPRPDWPERDDPSSPSASTWLRLTWDRGRTRAYSSSARAPTRARQSAL